MREKTVRLRLGTVPATPVWIVDGAPYLGEILE